MIRNTDYKPPFPWFGGKSSVAEIVWNAIGDVPNYVEPFCGSCAVLLLRPGGAGHIETVNDADGLLANFWRALKFDPEAVAEAADNPVNEADLHARHLWLLGERSRITERLMGDADFYDAKAAGWWAWGQCCWIGSGWCSGKGPWVSEDGEMVMRNPGQGVNRKLPHLGDPGKGECAERSRWLRGYLSEFVAHAVRKWAIEQGENPLMRIVLAGYEGEHEMPATWRVEEWKAVGGYGLIADDEASTGRANRGRERLWLSPACVRSAKESQTELFT